jgi:hypothetical protein
MVAIVLSRRSILIKKTNYLKTYYLRGPIVWPIPVLSFYNFVILRRLSIGGRLSK